MIINYVAKHNKLRVGTMGFELSELSIVVTLLLLE